MLPLLLDLLKKPKPAESAAGRTVVPATSPPDVAVVTVPSIPPTASPPSSEPPPA